MDFTSKITRQKLIFMLIVFVLMMIFLITRLFYIQFFSEGLQERAYEQQTRDRLINGERGDILDRNFETIATNITVGTVSVVNAEVENPEEVAKILSEKLELEYDGVLKKVNEKVALNRIKTKVDKALADEIRDLDLLGVKIEKRILSLIQWGYKETGRKTLN
ncbi:MAG: hypothetical protein ACK5LV_11115, partial [Lachnospirales bacterium]